jgi:hypothetical protein
MDATLTHQVMDERRECGEPHARMLARLAARAGRLRAGARLLFAVLIFWLLGC